MTELLGDGKAARPCRIYAPVGGHEDLLGYLVRRLLENGANTSFVNRLADDETPVSDIIADPVEIAERERVEGRRPESDAASARDLCARAHGKRRIGIDRAQRAPAVDRRDHQRR